MVTKYIIKKDLPNKDTLDKNLFDVIRQNGLKIHCIFTAVLLFVLAFLTETPFGIIEGVKKIVVSRDALITDYFELAGYGAAFFNAGVVFSVSISILLIFKVPFTGITMASLFTNLGYALWGKNLINIIPIIFGTFLYAKRHKSGMRRHVYTALFGTCLAPFVTEVAYILPFSTEINLIFAVIVGIFVGFILPSLSMHTASMHMGYNLYNIGFAGGILAFVMTSIMQSFGIKSEAVFIWRSGRPNIVVIIIYAYFILSFLFGLWLNKGRTKGMGSIMKHPGRAVTDFVLMYGEGAALINMSIIGITCATYIIAMSGDFSGPVIGAIMTAFGFAAFGAHIKNYFPVLLGVYLFTIISQYQHTTPGIQLAAIFAIGLAPVAGQFGVAAGIIAGALHSVISMCTSEIYGGLNLYNNGFSAGWVAIILIPAIESFMYCFKTGKKIEKKSK